MLLEYIVFITLLLAGILAYVLHKPSKDYTEIDFEYSRCESYIERRLYKALQFRGYYVRTQVRCGKYRIDIALPSYRLATARRIIVRLNKRRMIDVRMRILGGMAGAYSDLAAVRLTGNYRKY